MTDTSNDNLLARLAGQGTAVGPDPWAAVAASQPQHAAVVNKTGPQDEKLDQLLVRLTLTARSIL
jgi:hypothetical protein